MIGLLGVRQLRTMPVSLVVFPVREPVLLCLKIHRSQIESSVVSNECLEALLMMTCEIVHAKTSERCTNSTKMVLIYIGQVVGSIVNRCQIVLHALTRPVARNFLQPLLTESRQATTIRCNYHISLRGHDHKVPTIAPELRNRTLRTTFAEEQGGVLLGFVEVWRQYNPSQHILSIAGLYPTLLYFGLGELVENVLVLESQLSNLRLLRLLEVGGDDIEISWGCIVVTFHQQLFAIIHQMDGSKVIPSLCHLLELSLPVDGIQILCGMPNANEIDHSILGVAPYEIINIRVKALSQIFLLASC